jgi:hypothetical protein
MSTDTQPDTTPIGWFEPADNVCAAVVAIEFQGATYELRCENDAGHDPVGEPHTGTVQWVDAPENTDGPDPT